MNCSRPHGQEEPEPAVPLAPYAFYLLQDLTAFRLSGFSDYKCRARNLVSSPLTSLLSPVLLSLSPQSATGSD